MTLDNSLIEKVILSENNFARFYDSLVYVIEVENQTERVSLFCVYIAHITKTERNFLLL